MATVTADDIRVLAQSDLKRPVLTVVGDDLRVVPEADADARGVLYTKSALRRDYGDQITDIDAEVLAGGLTARITG